MFTNLITLLNSWTSIEHPHGTPLACASVLVLPGGALSNAGHTPSAGEEVRGAGLARCHARALDEVRVGAAALVGGGGLAPLVPAGAGCGSAVRAGRGGGRAGRGHVLAVRADGAGSPGTVQGVRAGGALLARGIHAVLQVLPGHTALLASELVAVLGARSARGSVRAITKTRSVHANTTLVERGDLKGGEHCLVDSEVIYSTI